MTTTITTARRSLARRPEDDHDGHHRAAGLQLHEVSGAELLGLLGLHRGGVSFGGGEGG